jgi:hypothetical protein
MGIQYYMAASYEDPPGLNKTDRCMSIPASQFQCTLTIIACAFYMKCTTDRSISNIPSL